MPTIFAGRFTRSVAFALIQAIGVALIIPVAYVLGQNFEFFPRTLIPVWTVARPEDLLPTMRFMSGAAFLVFLVSNLIFGPILPSTARRTAIEVYAFAIAITIGSVALFFFSMTVFDPELLLGAAVLGVLAFCLVHAVFEERSNRFDLRAGLAAIWKVIKSGFGLAGQIKPFPFALAAVMFTTTPILLAYWFKTDRQFADSVTAFRMAMLPNLAEGARYTTTNAYPGLTFLQPMMIRFDPNDPNRAFVLERAGGFYTFDTRDPINSKEMLFDLSEDVKTVYLETGAQSFAFHPDFDYGTSIGHNDLFVYYTSYTEAAQTNYLVSLDLSQSTPEARYESKFNLVELGGEPNASHNGGNLAFGPDGFLYFSVGDRLNNDLHQTIDQNFLGGIFRIDVDRQGGDVSFPPKRAPEITRTAGYYIPYDNPLVDVQNALEEYYAWGLRNPFRFTFDRQGRIWAGEVGAATWEEINIIEKGGNYQWPFAEGYVESGKPRPDPLYGVEKEPIFNYVHTAYDRAIIGGFVIEDARLSELNGKYIFGDNFSGNLFTIEGTGEKVETSEIIGRADQYSQRGLTSFARSPEGEILLTTMGGGLTPEGEILKLIIDDGSVIEAPEPSEETGELVMASADLGREHFTMNCTTCHGDEAKDLYIELGHNMPDFSDPIYQASRSDEDLMTIIKLGGGRLGVDQAMPPWEMIFTDQDIESIVLHLRTLEE
ncbi:MAG: PQQ-dependent sugar dehydrogenase [Pseudomonadota bacterium]